MSLAIRPMVEGDAEAVIAIYQDGIDRGDSTFEAQAPNWQDWSASHHSHSRLVAATESSVVGWAALAPVSRRQAYRGVAEVSVYVAPSSLGRGIGSLLLTAMIDSAEGEGIWTLQSSIFEENTASARLHARHGFRIVGRRERIARMTHAPQRGRWRDTIILERRSAHVGNE
ncbi:MAG: GNAT family N-acetyltransferase [Proteobacteria bacterium]|nr:GNAT family N-acetyltransferase [Pseudomonadota bacterium]MDA1057097.1 GNAT family N-acetyltransferase [Pseudomonadota bacterium]